MSDTTTTTAPAPAFDVATILAMTPEDRAALVAGLATAQKTVKAAAAAERAAKKQQQDAMRGKRIAFLSTVAKGIFAHGFPVQDFKSGSKGYRISQSKVNIDGRDAWLQVQLVWQDTVVRDGDMSTED